MVAFCLIFLFFTSMNTILRNPLILPVFIPTFLLRLGSGLLLPILPLYAKSFDISYGLVGLVLAAEGIGHLVGDLPAAIVLNRIGRKSAMLLGVLTVALSGAGLFFAPTIFMVFLLRFVGGIGGALWDISRYAYLADTTAVHQRGRALSVFGGISRIGTFLGPVIGGYIASVTSVKYPFLVYGGVTLLAAVVAAIAVEASHKRVSPPQHGLARHFANIFRAHRKNLITAGTGQLFAQTIRSGRYIIIPLYGAEVLGLGYEQIGLIMTTSGFIDMMMFYPAGVIMDRFGRKFANVPSFALQAIGMALIPLTQAFAAYLNLPFFSCWPHHRRIYRTSPCRQSARIWQWPQFRRHDDSGCRPCTPRRPERIFGPLAPDRRWRAHVWPRMRRLCRRLPRPIARSSDYCRHWPFRSGYLPLPRSRDFGKTTVTYPFTIASRCVTISSMGA